MKEMLHHQAKWSGDGSGQQEQLTGEAERILKQSQSKKKFTFSTLYINFFFWYSRYADISSLSENYVSGRTTEYVNMMIAKYS